MPNIYELSQTDPVAAVRAWLAQNAPSFAQEAFERVLRGAVPSPERAILGDAAGQLAEARQEIDRLARALSAAGLKIEHLTGDGEQLDALSTFILHNVPGSERVQGEGVVPCAIRLIREALERQPEAG